MLTLLFPMLIIAVLATTLRPTLTSTPLLQDIRLSTSMSLQVASLLVVLPVLCMGIFSLLLPWLGRRLSEMWITGGLLVIALAGLWRLDVMPGWGLIGLRRVFP